MEGQNQLMGGGVLVNSGPFAALPMVYVINFFIFKDKVTNNT